MQNLIVVKVKRLTLTGYHAKFEHCKSSCVSISLRPKGVPPACVACRVSKVSYDSHSCVQEDAEMAAIDLLQLDR